MKRIVHPEALPGEIFLGNVTEKHFEGLKAFKTKRLGVKAIDQVDGIELPEWWGLRPVFVRDEEDELCHLAV